MLGPNERYIVRMMFKNKIFSSDGQMFETFFTSIMLKHNPNFEQVKPYGNIGDRKNDGFDKTAGEYYQVFSPENIEKEKTISDAVNKLDEDFKGLHTYWNTLCPIKKYNFVVNDKYKGAPPQLHQKLLSLKQEYPEVEFSILAVNRLEDYFMAFTEDDMVSLLGCIVCPAAQLDYSALTEVLEHLMNFKGHIGKNDLQEVPDFEDKITFNKLSVQIASLLRSASYQVGALDIYFKRNSEFARSEIQKRITDCYLNACAAIDPKESDYSDLVFLKMLEDVCPGGNNAEQGATLVLFAYFFETCDIFERPEVRSNNDPT